MELLRLPRDLKAVGLWHLGMWFSCGSAGRTAELSLGGFSSLNDSVIVCIKDVSPGSWVGAAWGRDWLYVSIVVSGQ